MLFRSTIIAILTFITCFYYEYIMFLSDNFVLKLLEAIYFPNFAIYFLILAIINSTFFITILREKTPLSIKITNFTSTLIIDFIFILVLGIIISDKVDIYDTLTAIANPSLLICLELTTITFVAWYMINNFVKLIERTFKIKVKEIKQEVPAQIKIEKIEPVKPVLAPIPKPVHNFEILYEKFQNGEELNVEQYQILKNYLIENQ